MGRGLIILNDVVKEDARGMYIRRPDPLLAFHLKPLQLFNKPKLYTNLKPCLILEEKESANKAKRRSPLKTKRYESLEKLRSLT